MCHNIYSDGAFEHARLVIGDRWKVSIIQTLFGGPKSLLQIRTSIRHIFHKVLVSDLRELEQLGIITKQTISPIPAEQEYCLTEKGYALFDIFEEMLKWENRYNSGKSDAAYQKDVIE